MSEGKIILLTCDECNEQFRLDDLIFSRCPFCRKKLDEESIWRYHNGYFGRIEFIKDKRQKRNTHKICAILGALFAITGLLLLVNRDSVVGGPLTLFGVIFMALALGAHLKVGWDGISIKPSQQIQTPRIPRIADSRSITLKVNTKTERTSEG